MSEINEVTELIIQELAKKVVPPSVNDFYKEVGIAHRELLNQLPLLEIHNVARFHHTPMKNTIEKMSKFGEVVQAGGLRKYLKMQDLIKNEKSHKIKEQESKSELELKLITLQISQLEYQLEERDRKAEIDKLTIESLKSNNKYMKMILVLTIIGWIVTIIAENAQWGWSAFQEEPQIESPKLQDERKELYVDSLQSNLRHDSIIKVEND